MRKGTGGLSLAETVVALAILTAGFAMFARLFAYGLKGLARADERARAVAVADQEVARLKALGQSGDFVTLRAQDGHAASVNGLDLSVEVLERSLYSPSRSWEEPYIPGGEARVLEACSLVAVVRVRGPTAEVALPTLISEPRRALRTSPPPLELVGTVPPVLPAGESADFEAHLYAENGRELPTTFSWYVIAGTGSGTVKPARNGRQATFINQTTDGGGNTVYTGGYCELRVRALYFGEEIWGPSVTINLGT